MDIGPDDAGSVLRPVRILKVRDRLTQHWLSDDFVRKVLLGGQTNYSYYLPGADVGSPENFAVKVKAGSVPEAGIERFCRRVGTAMRDSDMYWVGGGFAEKALTASAKLPDVEIQPYQLPAENGLAVFERTVVWNDAHRDEQGRATPVHAIGWFTTPAGVWVTMYLMPELSSTLRDIGRELLREQIGFLMPHAPGGGAPYGISARNETATPLMKFIFSLWFLIKQPGYAEVEDAPVDKDIQRRYRRADRPYPAVRVVNLRRAPEGEGAAAGDGPGRTFKVRWKVGEHWRWQAYGPGRKQHYWKYIDEYEKGPEGAPLKARTPTIKKIE